LLHLEKLIELAIEEDLPEGDITTKALGIDEKIGQAELIAKEDLILSGTHVFSQVLKKICPDVIENWYFLSGDQVLKSQTVASFKGNLLPLLSAERIALNFLGSLSGIASFTNKFVEKVKHTPCKIIDTRKTMPGFRQLQKQAVIHGGGLNHRMSLSDAVLIKENHLKIYNDDLNQTLKQVRAFTDKPITIECKNLNEVKSAVENEVQRIMLDNMTNDMMTSAIELIPSKIEIEATGNMTLDRIQSVAEIGVHYISIGALTHSAPCADLSLLFSWEEK
jgi:nicotinate-nucleotide pyrophosphorylase (carboxylating)